MSELIEVLSEMEDLREELFEYSESERYKNDSFVLFWESWRSRCVVGDCFPKK